MKRIALFLVMTLTAAVSFSQNEKYVKAMEPLVTAVDTLRDKDALVTLANSFERIANAEKTQWLPFYYAALANVNAASTYAMDGSFTDKSADMDPLIDKAEAQLNKAEELSKDNSEIWIVRKSIASARLIANVMSRYQEYGPIAAAALEKAKKLNPENPRVYLLTAEDQYFTPEEYGGDKKEAKKNFELALTKYAPYKPESSIHPKWGKMTAEYLLAQIK